MKAHRLLLIVGTGAMLTGTAIAADSAATANAKPEKQVCRRVTRVGTRLGTTVCMTRAEWYKMEREGNESARRTVKDAEERNDHYVNPMQSGGG